MRTDSHNNRFAATFERAPLERLVASFLKRTGGVLAVAMALGAAWAGSSIVVSIPPYAEIAQRIAGPDVEVSVLLPPGASPHTFEPSPRDLARLEAADLIVLNGGIDRWAAGMVDALGSDAPLFVALTSLDGADLVEGGHEHGDHEGHDEHGHEEHGEHGHDEHGHDEHGHDEHGHDEHGHDEHDARTGAHDATALADVNPHVWLDPVRMRDIVSALADAWSDVVPDQADAIRARAAELRDELAALDAELRETLAPIHGAPFVPFHDAWPYFADRYGLELVIEIEPFPGREPSARYLADALGAIRDAGATAIFAEAQLGTRSARVLADEAGVRLGTLDPVGGVPGREGYAELLRYNARILVETLQDVAPRDP